MDVELVIGPVILGAEREADRVFERPKHAFDHRLAAVGTNDLRRAPFMLSRHEHQAPQSLAFQTIERRAIDGVG